MIIEYLGIDDRRVCSAGYQQLHEWSEMVTTIMLRQGISDPDRIRWKFSELLYGADFTHRFINRNMTEKTKGV